MRPDRRCVKADCDIPAQADGKTAARRRGREAARGMRQTPPISPGNAQYLVDNGTD